MHKARRGRALCIGVSLRLVVIDRADFHELIPFVVGFHIAHGACFGANNHGVCDGAVAGIGNATKEGSARNTCGGEENFIGFQETIDG